MLIPIGNVDTKDAFTALVDGITALPGYKAPAAFGVGIATTTVNQQGHEVLLDCWYPVVNNVIDTDPKTKKWGSAGTAALLANSLDHLSGTMTYEIHPVRLHDEVYRAFGPFLQENGHANIDAISTASNAGVQDNDPLGLRSTRVFVSFIDHLDDAPFVGSDDDWYKMRTAADLWHRLHQLSHRKVTPNGINLDGAFGLPTVVWTNHGPFLPEQVNAVRMRLRAKGEYLVLTGPQDKFPRLVDYVALSDKVRMADPNRVRLGAHLTDGTTVMHEGFVNLNGGTLGKKSMVEGRISAGVTVGDGSDIGGGASIMGTLSGGGTVRVSVGERCLLGANSGLGIVLGDDCIIESGTYITAGSKIAIVKTGGWWFNHTRWLRRTKWVKALELSGQSGLLFRRNSRKGRLEVLANTKAVTLNPLLHG